MLVKKHKYLILPMADQKQFNIDISLDTKGTRCPIPLIRAKQALKTMRAGQIVEVLSTDPSSKGDFDAMLKHLPDDLLAYEHVDGVDRFLIQKG
jgi:tRNA 2-thiouridine synthesizing protein A